MKYLGVWFMLPQPCGNSQELWLPNRAFPRTRNLPFFHLPSNTCHELWVATERMRSLTKLLCLECLRQVVGIVGCDASRTFRPNNYAFGSRDPRPCGSDASPACLSNDSIPVVGPRARRTSDSANIWYSKHGNPFSELESEMRPHLPGRWNKRSVKMYVLMHRASQKSRSIRSNKGLNLSRAILKVIRVGATHGSTICHGSTTWELLFA